MDWTAIYKTVGLCLISVVIEIISATKEGKNWFENLEQPKYALPFSFWYVVGGLYYLVCGIIAYRQFHISTKLFSTPVILLTLIMIINGLSNFLLFKFYSLKFFFAVLFPFALLLIGLIFSLYPKDKVSAGLAAIYLLWLGYDIYYFRMLLRRNT
jgi:tryptophan-rich sensory protein